MSTDVSKASISSRAWLLVALLVPVAFQNYLDRHVSVFAIFSTFAAVAVLSVIIVLKIRSRHTESGPAPIPH